MSRGMEQHNKKFHHTKNGMRYKTYKWLISGIFHSVFLDHGLLWINKKTFNEEEYFIFHDCMKHPGEPGPVSLLEVHTGFFPWFGNISDNLPE